MPFYWIELIIYKNKILRFKHLVPPVFIIGHWRSGTTYLQRLLVENSHTVYLTQYNALFPLGTLVHRRLFAKAFDKMVNLLDIQHPTHKLKLSSDFPSEEDIAFCSAGFEYTPMWSHIFSKDAGYFFDKYAVLALGTKESNAFIQEYCYLTKRINFNKKDKQLILKSPANTLRIPQLLSIYPDAKFIYLSRSFDEIKLSTIKLLRNNKRQWLNEMDDAEMDLFFNKCYHKLMQQYEMTSGDIPASNLMELEFEDLLNNPGKVMNEITAFLHWELSPAEKLRITKFIDKNHGIGVEKYARKSQGINIKN